MCSPTCSATVWHSTSPAASSTTRFPKALPQHKVQPVSRPVIETPKASPTEDFSYRARFEVTRSIEKVKCEGFEVKRPVYPSDEMIGDELERLRTQHSTLVARRARSPGPQGGRRHDRLILEVEGKPVDGANTKEIKAEIGATSYCRSSALRCSARNRPLQRRADVPRASRAGMLRGKAGEFQALMIKDIKERVLPALRRASPRSVTSSVR